MTNEQMFIAAVSALVAVVVVLWRQSVSHQKSSREDYKNVVRRLDDCEEDRERLWLKWEKLFGPRTDP